MKEHKEIVKWLSEIRVSRTEKAAPESIRGEVEPRITPPKKRRRKKELLITN